MNYIQKIMFYQNESNIYDDIQKQINKGLSYDDISKLYNKTKGETIDIILDILYKKFKNNENIDNIIKHLNIKIEGLNDKKTLIIIMIKYNMIKNQY